MRRGSATAVLLLAAAPAAAQGDGEGRCRVLCAPDFKVEPIDRLNRLMLTVLPPLEASGEGRYYDPQGRLLPQLQWYPRLIREIHLANRTLHTVLVDDAIPDLRQRRVDLEHRSVF